MLAISQEIFVSKLPSVSMNLAETLSTLNKHFDRPLTKGKAEAIISLANLGTKETNKMKKSTRATVAPVDAVEFVA